MDSGMYISASWVIGILILVIQGLLGWFANVLFNKIKELETKDDTLMKEIQKIAVALPSDYTAKREYKEMGDNIFSAIRGLKEEVMEVLREVKDDLKNKADKS